MDSVRAFFVGALASCLVLAASAAGAQVSASDSQSTRQVSSQGPMVVEPISSGVVFTPEIRFTKVNHSNATLVGGQGGWLYDDSLFIGFGGYWMTNGKNGNGLAYGGMVVGYSAPLGDRVRAGVRGLFGYGEAGITESFIVRYPTPRSCPTCSAASYTDQMHWNVGFLVFEPQATVTVKATKRIAFEFGGGYRVVGDTDGWNRDLRGGFGSVGVRFGPF